MNKIETQAQYDAFVQEMEADAKELFSMYKNNPKKLAEAKEMVNGLRLNLRPR